MSQNEIRLGDSGGGQGFGIKSSKDMNVVVEPDKSEDVTVDITHSVGVDLIEQHGLEESLEIVAAPGSSHSGTARPGGEVPMKSKG